MNFSREKNGYNIAEVDSHIRALESAETDRTARIEELKTELNKVTKQLDAEKQKRELINRAIYNAVAKADQIETLSRRKYEQDMVQLKAFHEKWVAYYNRILERFPIDDELKEMSAFNRRMNDILNGKEVDSLESYLMQEKERVSKSENSNNSFMPKKSSQKTEILDPVSKIKEFLDNNKGNFGNLNDSNGDEYEGEGAFSFEEALNPTDDLSTIMRDLGFDVED